MKKLLPAILVFVLFVIQRADAQTNYINHTLKTGETLSALAKQFNTTVGDIMRANGMHADSKLVVGSTIKIPSTGSNTVVVEETKPVVPPKQEIVAEVPSGSSSHIVQKGETVFGISKQHNITTDQLRQWNNLTDNNLEVGQVLVVGNVPAGNNNNTQAVVKDPAQDSYVKQEDKTVVTATPAEPDNSASKKQRNSKKDKKPLVPVAENTDKTPAEIAAVANNEGYFSDAFTAGMRRNKPQTLNGRAMSFKAATGWNDYKYYVLMNDVEIGTIVKLTSAAGKTVYAKVLWNLGDMKENDGLACRISNAAVAALGVNVNLFDVEITWY